MEIANMIILIILIIVLLLSFFFINKTLKKKEAILEEVKLQENIIKNDGFALMLQQSDGKYKESDSSSWPTDMVFNSELSGCVDINGNKIENSLSFNSTTNSVTVKANKTSYCYVYFDIDREAPIVTATINNNNTKEITLTIISNEDGEYCVNESSTINNRLNCVFSGNIKENESIETNVFKKSGNYYVHIKDSVGNVGISEMLSINISTSISNYLIENVSSDVLWKSTLEDDGYRFVGTNPDNYICFGTTDKDTCVNDTDKYMYRIIGIFEDEVGNKHAKVIKKEALNAEYAWHSDYSADIDWNESDLYKGLNGSYFLTNTNYSYMQNTSWTDKIATWNYTMTNTKTLANKSSGSYGLKYPTNTGKVIYLHELNRSSKSNETCHYVYENSPADADCNVGEWKNLNTKISLMYVSDYVLSLGEISLSYVTQVDYSKLEKGWMQLSNNDSGYPKSSEATMSRFGNSSTIYFAYDVSFTGGVNTSRLSFTDAVRPVFYLESNVEFAANSGDGSINNPYIVALS